MKSLFVMGKIILVFVLISTNFATSVNAAPTQSTSVIKSNHNVLQTATTITLDQPSALNPNYIGGGHECDTGWHYFSNVNSYVTLNTQSGGVQNYGIWQPNLPTSGNWIVEVHNPVHDYYTWPCDPYTYLDHDTSSAHYEIHYNGGSQTIAVNQQTSPEWVTLGTFSFAAGGSGYIKLGDVTGESNYTRAIQFSGMRFTLASENGIITVPEPNLTPAYGQDYCATGWYRYTNTSGNNSYLTLNTNQPAQSTNSVRWTPNIPVTGRYRVQAYIPDHPWFIWRCTGVQYDEDTSDAQYMIHHNGGITTVSANQMPVYNDWLDIGVYTFSSGTSGYVELKDLNSEANLTRYISFSALRFMPETSTDTTYPSGNILTPVNGTTVSSSSILFTADASDNPGGSGVDRVEFWIFYDNIWHWVATSSTAPFGITWSVPQGLSSQQLKFAIRVWDRAGLMTIDPGGYRLVQYKAVSHGSTIRQEAAVDIGMPYYVERGCPSPFVGCGKPYHGFDYGVCTDLVYDAYNAGAFFNLQDALTQDARAHPGRYRLGTIRVADDLWTYFNYNQTVLPHSQPYQVGDVAFIQWAGQNIMSHVGIISQIDANGRPTKMIDAAGEYWGSPASERSWSSAYDQVVQGHGRLLTGPQSQSVFDRRTDMPLQVLFVEVDSPDIQISVRDLNGKKVDNNYDENLLATNNYDFIPYISRAKFLSNTNTQQISIIHPLNNGNTYHLQLTGTANTSFNLKIWTMQDKQTTIAVDHSYTISTGESKLIEISLSAASGQIEFSASEPVLSPLLDVQSPFYISVSRGTISSVMFNIANGSGQINLVGVSALASNLYTPMGQMFESGRISILLPQNSDIPANSNREINISVDSRNVANGVYFGNLILTTINDGNFAVPVVLLVDDPKIYLPLVKK